jgi:hypothetical protein
MSNWNAYPRQSVARIRFGSSSVSEYLQPGLGMGKGEGTTGEFGAVSSSSSFLWGGVTLSPLVKSGTIWPIVPASDDS